MCPNLLQMARLSNFHLVPIHDNATASRNRLAISTCKWVTSIAYLVSGPAVLTVIVQYRDYIVPRDAAARGAILCPSMPNLIGKINIFSRTKYEDVYPGEPLEVIGRDLGYNLGYNLNIHPLFQNRIFTAEPENIKAILATEFPSLEKGLEFRGLMEPLLEPLLGTGRISDFDLFDLHAENAIPQLKARLREGHLADFQDMVSRFTLDAVTLLPLRARRPESLRRAPLPSLPHRRAAQAFGEHRPLAEFWVDKLEAPMHIVRDFLDPILRDAVAKQKSMDALGGGVEKRNDVGDREVQEGESLLEHLVNYTDDYTILRDKILNISVAGRDTTASLLTFTVYMLAEHPEVLKKLCAEILHVVGPMHRPTHDDLREMKYLRRPKLFRSSDGGRPIYVPSGTRSRRKDLWGPDALEYDPDRFLDERLHKPNPFIFLPFNAGPRMCLRQQHDASFLVRLLQTFSGISLSPEAQPPESRPPAEWTTDDKTDRKAHEKIRPRSHLTLYVVDGLWVRMEEA
ncbi:cytochrome P450, partial [Mycena crocata]